MRILSLKLKNFQAIDSLALSDFGRVNILIGPRHSGKTSILESLYFQFHHQSIQDEQAFFAFLNRTHGKADGYYSLETTIREGRRAFTITTEVSTKGKRGSAGDTITEGGSVLQRVAGKKLTREFGNRMKYLSSWERSKAVYYPGKETTEQRKKRFRSALDGLAKQRVPWGDFLSALQELFPHIQLADKPKEAIEEFFGLGFLSTVKMLMYLYDKRYDVVLIDEPEIYFYPGLARKFLHILREAVAEEYTQQVFIATHSPMFLNQKNIRDFYHIQRDGTGRVKAAKRNRDELLRSLDYAGMRPDSILTAEMILYVEGPWDIAVFEEFVAKFWELQDVHLSIQQLGGGAVGNLNLDPVRLKENNLFSFVVLDSEKRSARDAGDQSHYRFAERAKRAHVYSLVLERRAIENYFTPRALRSVFRGRVPKHFENRPYRLLGHQLRWYEKEHNRRVAKAMTRKEIESYPDLRRLFATLIAASRQFR